MKIKLFLIAVLAGVALVGCNRENGPENGVEGDRFMGFHISMPNATTKADGTGAPGSFEYGTDEENAISSVYFFFYKDGLYISYGIGKSTAADWEVVTGTTPSVEELWQKSGGKGVVVIESSLHTTPNQVLCVVNCPNAEYFRNKPLSEAQAALMASNPVETITGVNGSETNRELSFAELNGDGSAIYFTMFNSPEIVNGEEQYVLPITDANIYTEAEGGKDAAEANPVEVYVERVATKVNVTTNASFTKDASLDDWDIEIDYWGLNGVSQNTYAIHKISKDWKGATWNTPAWVEGPHRINWAIDPDYSGTGYAFDNEDFYPHSARDYGLQEGGVTTGSTARTALARLKYYSMNEIKAHSEATLPKYDKLRQMYALENTFDATGQNDARFVGTHVLVIATLKEKTKPAADLYMYMGTMRTKAGYQTSLINRVKTDFGKIYVDAAGTTELVQANADIYLEERGAYKPDDFNATGPDQYYFKLAEVVTGDKGYHDGYITLYPKSTTTLYKEDLPANPGTFVALTDAEIKEAFLKDVIDLANKYKDGKMWYCIPIEHFGKAKSGGNLLEGNYGMVRNHFYNVDLTGVATFGHGISDPNEPIVPGDKVEKWYLAAKINVNSWQIVTQSNTLVE